MDTLLASLHLAALIALAFGLDLPGARRLATGLLATTALVALALGLASPGTRSLTTVHTYAGFAGADLEVSMVPFPTGTVTAPGWAWPLPVVAFAAFWIVALRRLAGSRPRHPVATGLVFAWTAAATWLGMQYLAAPAELIQPMGLDRMLFPAGLALAFGAGRSAPTFARLLFAISLGTVAARLPAALFSKLASDLHLGGCLDVTAVRDIVNPMTHLQFEPRLVPGSPAHQFWLIWLEHILIFPALYLLSLSGIAFGIWMFHRHGPEPAAAAGAVA